MAQKDYVQRSQAKKQAAKRSARNSSSSTNAPVPWLKVGAALCVVGLFIFGLYRLGTTSDVGAGGVSEPLANGQNNDGNDLNAAQMNENTLETVI
jgi:cell division protein FtsN